MEFVDGDATRRNAPSGTVGARETSEERAERRRLLAEERARHKGERASHNLASNTRK